MEEIDVPIKKELLILASILQTYGAAAEEPVTIRRVSIELGLVEMNHPRPWSSRRYRINIWLLQIL